MVNSAVFALKIMLLCLLMYTQAADRQEIKESKTPAEPTELPCNSSKTLSESDTMLLLEMKHTKDLINLYENRLKFLNTSIHNKNSTKAIVKEMDYQYMLNLFESETIKTPSNKMLAKAEGTELLRL